MADDLAATVVEAFSVEGRLLHRLTAAERRLAVAEGLLRRCEWVGDTGYPLADYYERFCPICERKEPEHEPGCALAAYLAPAPGAATTGNATARPAREIGGGARSTRWWWCCDAPYGTHSEGCAMRWEP